MLFVFFLDYWCQRGLFGGLCLFGYARGGGRVWQWMKYRDDDEGEGGFAEGWRCF